MSFRARLSSTVKLAIGTFFDAGITAMVPKLVLIRSVK